MRGTWRGLGLLLLLPWMVGCVSGPRVRLDMGEGSPIVHELPAAEPPPVQVSQEALVQAMTELVLHMPLKLSLPRREGRVVLVSWGGERDALQQMLRGQCSPMEPEQGCLVLPENAPPLETLERLRLALSFAMGSVWEGAAVPLGELTDPVAFKVMLYTAMSTWLLTLMMPEPVTKGLAAVLTVYLVAYLGLGPVWSMVKAGWVLLEESERARTVEEVKRAGQRFGRVLGDNGMRVFLLLATAALGGQTGFVGRGPGLPGFRQAALASPARTGVRLEAAGQVRTVVLGARELVVGLAPTAVASSALGPGGGFPPEHHSQTQEGHDGSPPQALLESQSKHIQKIDNIIRDHAKPSDFEGVAKELAGQKLPKPGGGYWDHRREMLQSIRDLKRHVRALEGSLDNPAHSFAVRSYVQRAIDKARAMLSRMEDALSGGRPRGQ
ncbi:putative RNase toxin 28 of polymorphic toxin system [Archangium gephyra]|uniref:Lipoprotein n=1 Tax=Archangium gephyra TaxID=48 RepID=A0AAC8Q4X5_9BACT|nr:polymorphic toxin type 28 domain-containing protein [Archangium gephyra]AKJ00458.1 putative lipoprotein [Archangium gephyra]REG32844.1 putative RNase toxin 28 of polymorphic toxin system [Archangium gephyra]